MYASSAKYDREALSANMIGAEVSGNARQYCQGHCSRWDARWHAAKYSLPGGQKRGKKSLPQEPTDA